MVIPIMERIKYMLEESNNKMLEEIKEVIINSRQKVAYAVNNTMLEAYWNVERIIVENEQNGNIKAKYEKQTDFKRII